jgi:hypothetical protein
MLVLAHAYNVSVTGKVWHRKGDGAMVGLYAVLVVSGRMAGSVTFWPFDCVTGCAVNTAYGLPMHSIVNMLSWWMQNLLRSLSSGMPIVQASLREREHPRSVNLSARRSQRLLAPVTEGNVSREGIVREQAKGLSTECVDITLFNSLALALVIIRRGVHWDSLAHAID